MLKDSLHLGKDLGENCFAVKSNPEVISHVEKNKNSIGIIGVSWISDPDDSLVRYFMKKIQVAEIKPKKITIESITWKPIQGNIHLRQYPFWREVFVVSREARTGLGTGFASFLSGDQGQRIILKAGLVPSKAAIRTIELY
jgi:phosphate transport system substrate-binding protein